MSTTSCDEAHTRRKIVFVTPSVSVVDGRLVAEVPCQLRSEANIGGRLRERIHRKATVKRAMRETLGLHLEKLVPFARAYHSGKALSVKLTRLGGRRLDAMANLGRSLKSVEDVLAGAMLADDGDARWRATAHQEPGGVVGVRIEVEVIG